MNYSHDANGNQTIAGPWNFTYNLAGQMTSAVNGNTKLKYTYDGYGNRRTAALGTNATGVTKYLWDTNNPIPLLALERSSKDALVRRYLNTGDPSSGPVSMTTTADIFYYHPDSMGSTANLTNSSGVTQWSYSYQPFGQTRAEVKGPGKAPVNPMRYTGQMFDVSSGLYHLRARQYDPATGRFLGSDPVAPSIFDPSASSYGYVGNRPTVLIDPLGLFSWSSTLRTVSLVAAVTAIVAGLALTGGTTLPAMPAVLAAFSVGIGVTAEAIDSSPCRGERIALTLGVGLVGGAIAGGGLSYVGAKAAMGATAAIKQSRLGIGIGAGADLGMAGVGFIKPNCRETCWR